MIAYLASCGCILTGGLFALILPRKIKGIVYAVFSGAGLVMLALPSISIILSGLRIMESIDAGFPLNTFSLAIDPLAAFFIILIGLGNFLTAWYSIGYIGLYPEERSCSFYFFFLSLLFVSMLLLAAVRNAFAFLILWEIMSLSSFFLVAYEHHKKETVDAAFYYFIAMQIGFVFLLCGFIILTIKSGSADFADFPQAFSGDPVFTIIIFVLLFIGFGTKCGFIPFHTWLPKAHPQAPTPVSAAMSGIMIKTGIYGILRIITFIKDPMPLALPVGVIVISLVSGVTGIICAIAQRDIKKMLAYSSIENIGIIGLGIGTGMLGLSLGNPALAVCGFAGGILHTMNHFLFKSLLFFGAGAVYFRTKTRNMELLGGIARSMPAASLLFLAGSAAIAGLPPLNGFIGEFAIYFGLLKGITQSGRFFPLGFALVFSGLAFISALALFCFTKTFGIVFLGNPRDEGHKAQKDAPLSMLIPMMIIGALIVFIGFVPWLVFDFFRNVIGDTCGMASISPFSGSLAAGYSSISFAFLIFFALLAAAILLRFSLVRGKKNSRFKTWACGYQGQSPRLQYTASSFAFSLTSLFAPLLKQKVVIDKTEKKDSPVTNITHIKTETGDLVEKNIVNPVTGCIEKALRLFHWIQSGNTQQYIFYGVIFLLALIIVIFGVRI